MKIMNILTENHKNDFGCLMAYPQQKYTPLLDKFNKSAIPDNIIYNDPQDPTYGRETDYHVTLLYGFTKDLAKKDIDSIIDGVKPFYVILNRLSTFSNEKYDVVKFDVSGDILFTLNEKCKQYPYESKYPEYKPHMTLGYVKPNSFTYEEKSANIPILMDRVTYSGRNGKKITVILK